MSTNRRRKKMTGDALRELEHKLVLVMNNFFSPKTPDIVNRKTV